MHGGQARPDRAAALCPRKQFNRANRIVRKLCTYLGRVIGDIGRKVEGRRVEAVFAMALARRVYEQEQRQRGPTLYSLHAPEVECVGKGKAHRPYEFGATYPLAPRLAKPKAASSPPM